MADNAHFYNAQSGADNTDTTNIWLSSFAGTPMIQAWQDIMLWERFLHQYNPKFIMELGTANGGLSTYLAVQAWSLQAGFLTVDWQDWVDHNHPLWQQMGLDKCFLHVDMWTPEFAQSLRELLDGEHNHPFLLLCDGGNKPKEMQTFSKLLRPGDYMAVHDFNNEVGDADLVGLPIQKLLQAECENLKSLTRFFLRI